MSMGTWLLQKSHEVNLHLSLHLLLRVVGTTAGPFLDMSQSIIRSEITETWGSTNLQVQFNPDYLRTVFTVNSYEYNLRIISVSRPLFYVEQGVCHGFPSHEGPPLLLSPPGSQCFLKGWRVTILSNMYNLLHFLNVTHWSLLQSSRTTRALWSWLVLCWCRHDVNRKQWAWWGTKQCFLLKPFCGIPYCAHASRLQPCLCPVRQCDRLVACSVTKTHPGCSINASIVPAGLTSINCHPSGWKSKATGIRIFTKLTLTLFNIFKQ